MMFLKACYVETGCPVTARNNGCPGECPYTPADVRLGAADCRHCPKDRMDCHADFVKAIRERGPGAIVMIPECIMQMPADERQATLERLFPEHEPKPRPWGAVWVNSAVGTVVNVRNDRGPPEGANCRGIGPDTDGGLNPDYVAPPTIVLPTDSQERKDTPIYSGVLRYFPRALAYIAKVSKAGNDKHNPGQPLHWSKDKSNDHGDCVARHLIEAGTVDPEDKLRHSGKLAWRALALLETELEEAGQ